MNNSFLDFDVFFPQASAISFDHVPNKTATCGKDCQDVCCAKFQNPLYTPPRGPIPAAPALQFRTAELASHNFFSIQDSPHMTSTSNISSNSSSNTFRRRLNFDEDVEEYKEEHELDACPQTVSLRSSPACSSDEDEDLEYNDEELFERAVDLMTFLPAAQPQTPSWPEQSVPSSPTPYWQDLDEFLDFAQNLRRKLPAHGLTTKKQQLSTALTLLHESFGGKEKVDISTESKEILANSSKDARALTKKNSRGDMYDLIQIGGKFHCQLCDTAETVFKTREGALLHFRSIHINFKPYACLAPGCEQSFARRTDLRLHLIRKHEEQRPFACKMYGCDKGFASSCEMKRHLQVEHHTFLLALCGPAPQITESMVLPYKPNTAKRARHRKEEEEEEDDYDDF